MVRRYERTRNTFLYEVHSVTSSFSIDFRFDQLDWAAEMAFVQVYLGDREREKLRNLFLYPNCWLLLDWRFGWTKTNFRFCFFFLCLGTLSEGAIQISKPLAISSGPKRRENHAIQLRTKVSGALAKSSTTLHHSTRDKGESNEACIVGGPFKISARCRPWYRIWELWREKKKNEDDCPLGLDSELETAKQQSNFPIEQWSRIAYFLVDCFLAAPKKENANFNRHWSLVMSTPC